MKHGYPVWMDRLQGILPGDPWRKSLEQGVNNAAGVVVCLSRNYVESTWCRRELQRAHSLKKPIFPVLLGPVPDELWPMEIQDRQYADFQSWTDTKAYQTAFESLLTGLDRNLGPRLGPGPALIPSPLGPADSDRDDPEDQIERGMATTKELEQADSFAAFEAENLHKEMELLLKQYQAAALQYRLILDDALRVKLELQKDYYKAEWEKLKIRMGKLEKESDILMNQAEACKKQMRLTLNDADKFRLDAQYETIKAQYYEKINEIKRLKAGNPRG